MLHAFLRAVTEIFEPGIRRWLLAGVLLALALWAGLAAAAWWLLYRTRLFEIPLLEMAADTLAAVGVLVLPVLVFPGIVIALTSLFLDRIVDAVEERHYPGLGPARATPLAEQMGDALRLIGLTLLINLLLLPLLLLPPLHLPLFYLANGYLISREYVETIARRRLPRAEVAAFRRRRRGSLLAVGAAVAALLTVPVVNLTAPVVGIVALVHLYHRWQARAAV